MLLRLLHLRPGEASRVLWLCAIGIAYSAATTLGDDIALSVFVSRVGSSSIPRMWLLKGLLDVLAAAAYVPLAANRDATSVWRLAILIYVVVVLGSSALIGAGGTTSAYVMYVGHECAWTILTIHWGVFVLQAFDASQARRLFPLLFTSARIGGMLAGGILLAGAESFGATNLMPLAASCAAIAGLLTLLRPARLVTPHADVDEPDGGRPRPWSHWRAGKRSPLVRAIAWSTAAMVLVRYGLDLMSIDAIHRRFHGQEDQIAEFLGWFSTIANAASVILGVFIVPRLLARYGVSVANMLYAFATTAAFGLLLGAPSLAVALVARFTYKQLKDALKTPLSTLFYGAEPPGDRALARAYIFGFVIPAATMITAGLFEMSQRTNDPAALMSSMGLAASVAFCLSCHLQNKRWRTRLRELLHWQLQRTAPSAPDRLDAATEQLRVHSNAAGSDSAELDAIARGLSSADERVVAVAEEVLSEAIERRAAHRIAEHLAPTRSPGK